MEKFINPTIIRLKIMNTVPLNYDTGNRQFLVLYHYGFVSKFLCF